MKEPVAEVAVWYGEETIKIKQYEENYINIIVWTNWNNAIEDCYTGGIQHSYSNNSKLC